jgi:SM-20-related protein
MSRLASCGYCFKVRECYLGNVGLNDIWDGSEGRLRKPDGLNDFIAEIPPDGGTFASFLRSENSWHGHEPYVGERRYVMVN